MDADPNFNEADWFMSFFDAFDAGSRVFVFPSFMLTHFGGFNLTLPGMDAATAGLPYITLEQAYALHRQFAPENMYFLTPFGALELSDPFDIHRYVSHSLYRFFDFDEGRVDFNNPEFIELLTRADAALDGQQGNFQRYVAFRTPGGLDVLSGRYSAMIAPHRAFDMFSIFDNELPFGSFVPFADSYGRGFAGLHHGYVLSGGTTAEQRGLAWDFMMFIHTMDEVSPETGISPRHGNTWVLNGVSVNRALAAYADRIWYPNMLSIGFSSREGWSLTHDVNTTMDIITGSLAAWADMPLIYERAIPWAIQPSFDEIVLQYQDGLITAQTAAAELHNRLTLVLMEMN